MTEKDFTEIAFCQNCKHLQINETDKDFKTFSCKQRDEPVRLKQHCNLFDFEEERPHLSEEELNVKTLSSVLNEGIPNREWYIEKILPKPGVLIIGGPAASKKTWAGMQATLAIASGRDFLNQFDCKKCKVLYIDEENGEITLPLRFDLLIKGHELNDYKFDNIFISIFNNVTLDTLDGQKKLHKLILNYMPEVVILDSMVRCMAGDEDKAGDVKRLFKCIKQYLKLGISFIILHHTTKKQTNNMGGLRGSGDFAAFADVVLMFQSGREGYCNVNAVKNRHLAKEDLGEFFCKLEEINGGLIFEWKGLKDAVGNVVERCADEIGEWIKDNQLSTFESRKSTKLTQAKGFSKNCHYSALKQMVDDGRLTKLKRGRYKVNTDYFHVSEERVN